jgi:hypothetical protein
VSRHPGTGDRGALQELVSDLVATPLDRSKPRRSVVA